VVEEMVHLHQVVHLMQLLTVEKKVVTHLLLDTLLQEVVEDYMVMMVDLVELGVEETLEALVEVLVMKVDTHHLKELTAELTLERGVMLAAVAEVKMVQLEILQVVLIVLVVLLEEMVVMELIMDLIFLV
jgi:hypothetical protein